MIHICPTEIALFMMVFDHVKLYLFHLKHILMTKWYDKDCEVCND